MNIEDLSIIFQEKTYGRVKAQSDSKEDTCDKCVLEFGSDVCEGVMCSSMLFDKNDVWNDDINWYWKEK